MTGVQVENLRSSVARVAMACMGDMFVYTGRQMDPVSNTHTHTHTHTSKTCASRVVYGRSWREW